MCWSSVYHHYVSMSPKEKEYTYFHQCVHLFPGFQPSDHSGVSVLVYISRHFREKQVTVEHNRNSILHITWHLQKVTSDELGTSSF